MNIHESSDAVNRAIARERDEAKRNRASHCGYGIDNQLAKGVQINDRKASE